MKTKILLTALTLLLSLQFMHAQYLVSATYVYYILDSKIHESLSELGFNTDSMTFNDIKLYKITYNTTDVYGDPTVATGAIYIPQVECDTLPLVSYQHGTVFHRLHVPSNWYIWPSGYLYSGNGYITTMPDYLGMGDNPGLHPYIHWESEATASIDLIRAAREFLNGSLGIWDNNQLFLAGYSQGGHSTMAVHKYITDNNLQSEFNVVASSPMSPALPLYDVQMPGMLDEDSTYYATEFLPYIFASYQMVYGNLYENPSEYYDPPYDVTIPAWLASGIHSGDEWAELIPKNFYDFMQDSVVDNIINNPNHPFNVDLRLNDLHSWVPDEPVRMLYCGKDSMVFPKNSIMTRDTMQALGATQVDALNLDWYGTHETCWLETFVYAVMWFDSLNAGCQMVNPICMLNGAAFSTQAKIDNFPINYPYCTEIGGDVVISGSDITNLDSLITLKSINGNLEIHTNEALKSLSGLDSLGSINGNLEIHTNGVLKSLSGLDSLGSINGNFKVLLNDVLTDFTGIENLSAINGNLAVAYNPLLNSLTGLGNIEPGSIDDLTIAYNDNLSFCEVESICIYLDITDGNVKIQDNATGCNSQDEVELECTTSVDEAGLSDKILIYPNPFSTATTIEYELSSPGIVRLEIYNPFGKQVEVIEQIQVKGLQKIIWTPEQQPNGMYHFRLQTGEHSASGKIVLMK